VGAEEAEGILNKRNNMYISISTPVTVCTKQRSWRNLMENETKKVKQEHGVLILSSLHVAY
jgi:hypothetical protein